MFQKRLNAIIADLPIRLIQGQADLRIHDLCEDSRQVNPGSLFVARRGTATDGRRYIADALERGAAAILSDQPLDLPAEVALLTTPDVTSVLPHLAERFFDQPGRHLLLIGITGTNGKTTTAYMIRHLLNHAGRRCGLIGTVEIDDGRTRTPAQMTTPGPIELSRLLARMVTTGCDCCVMEVSSHALDQGRTAALSFDAALFTNLTGDHLDYHQSMERYAAAKARLFEHLDSQAHAIVNADDPLTPRMLQDCPAQPFYFSLANQPPVSPQATARILQASADATDCVFDGPWGSWELRLPLIGRHNVANMLGALSVAHLIGAEEANLRQAILHCPPVPGRLEPVRIPEQDLPYSVIVDYAHTDDALKNVLTALRPVTRGRLRVVFGCGGDRDASKRPRMAEIACDLADQILITSDNPRTEDPQQIITDILAGVAEASRQHVEVIPDRREAIRQAIQTAQPDDVILIAGKGHEDYQILGTTKHHFDDREEARQAMLAAHADSPSQDGA